MSEFKLLHLNGGKDEYAILDKGEKFYVFKAAPGCFASHAAGSSVNCRAHIVPEKTYELFLDESPLSNKFYQIVPLANSVSTEGMDQEDGKTFKRYLTRFGKHLVASHTIDINHLEYTDEEAIIKWLYFIPYATMKSETGDTRYVLLQLTSNVKKDEPLLWDYGDVWSDKLKSMSMVNFDQRDRPVMHTLDIKLPNKCFYPDKLLPSKLSNVYKLIWLMLIGSEFSPKHLEFLVGSFSGGNEQMTKKEVDELDSLFQGGCDEGHKDRVICYPIRFDVRTAIVVAGKNPDSYTFFHLGKSDRPSPIGFLVSAQLLVDHLFKPKDSHMDAVKLIVQTFDKKGLPQFADLTSILSEPNKKVVLSANGNIRRFKVPKKHSAVLNNGTPIFMMALLMVAAVIAARYYFNVVKVCDKTWMDKVENCACSA